MESSTNHQQRMGKVVELRDVADARRYVAQGLHFQRAVVPTPTTISFALKVSLSIVSGGDPLPPVGFVADFGHAVFGSDRGQRSRERPPVPGWPAHQCRAYEDYVLGKVTADWTIERATDALRRYSIEDRPRGLAYAIQQLRNRGGIGGTDLSPAVVRELLALPPEEAFRIGAESLAETGPHPLLLEQYMELVTAFRRLSELLGPEDLTALEQRTALAEFGQYVAHRQIVTTANQIDARLPTRPPRPRPGRMEVPTRVADEDIYPVGGYASIGTKGSVESLLHSQLAYLDDGPQPDLFTVKFVRDELFYYTRDENQFLRRKRAFVIVLDPSLVLSRVKDPDAPVQRIVLALSATLVLVRKLIEWLTTDALKIELLLPAENTKRALGHEEELLQILLRESIDSGIVSVDSLSKEAVPERLEALGRSHQLHVLTFTTDLQNPVEQSQRILVSGSRPEWKDSTGDIFNWTGEDAVSAWSEAALAVLREWV